MRTMTHRRCLSTFAPFALAFAILACRDGSAKAPPVEPPAATAAVSSVAMLTPTTPPTPAPEQRAAPACRQLARKCHGHDESELARACHRMGHAAKSEDECLAKTSECLAACSGGEEPHEGHEH